jgi:hypothetical protein
MSQVLIQQYLNQLQDLRKISGTHRESVVREAFKDPLKGSARSHDLVFIPVYETLTAGEAGNKQAQCTQPPVPSRHPVGLGQLNQIQIEAS